MATDQKGYDVELFLNQNEAKNYLCVICQDVFNGATSIGCNEDHIFCKKCLDNYCRNKVNIQCPSCRHTGLPKDGIRASKFTDRIVRNLKVKCKLQYEQKVDFVYDHDFKRLSCEWSGELNKLDSHINDECPLLIIQCEYCKKSMKRYAMDKHDAICPEREILCAKNCKKLIKRKDMSDHISNECEMTKLSCDDCKADVLRKEIKNHKSVCPEVELECPFSKYGCQKTEKRKAMDKHLTQERTTHLQLKVSYLETQINMYKIEASKCDSHKILLLLESKSCYICTLQSKKKKTINIASFMNENHNRFCIAKNIGFNKTKQIGFDTKDIGIIKNDIVFGVSKNKISAVCIDNKVCKTFQGDMTIADYKPFYSENNGLMIIGGRGNSNKTIANKDIYSIQFNGARFLKMSFTKSPYSTVNPSVCELMDSLFVCGGWWNKSNLSTCYMYNFENKQWTALKNMNHSHQSGGICVWKERGNKFIVAAGYSNASNKFVEEYDMHKNIWIDFPNLNEKHESYPPLFTSNNILFCVGGVNKISDNLGCIELYDPRDKTNKWIYVDTVENYFNIPKDAGAGFNCFLPL